MTTFLPRLVLGSSAMLLLMGVQGHSQAPAQPKFVPKLEAVAETKLLMEGLNKANFRGLENMLKQKPADLEAWTFARGQALLIAETGNLLLLRPPRNQGRDTWQMRATELRDSATALAKQIARRDYEGSRTALGQLANSCNRCHQSFQVAVRIVPFADPAPREP
jgi:cytochrome c556